MPRSSTLLDPITGISSPFGVNDSGSPIFDCIRLISGLVNIRIKSTGAIIKPRFCHLTQKRRRIKKSEIESLIRIVFDGDLSISNVERYLSRSSADNRLFWEDLKSELVLCIISWHYRSYLESFLYLYRLMELISVALPLVYASSEIDYKKALEFLKTLTANPRDADLAVLANFIKTVEKLGGYERLEIDYRFVEPTDWHSEAIHQFDSFIFPEKKILNTRLPDGLGFSVPFSSVPHLIITCRNKMFHKTQAGNNFNLDAMDGTDALCKTLVKPTLYWLSLVIVEVVKVHAKRYV